MPVYEYTCPKTGVTVDDYRPVDKRDEPLVLTLRRRPVPSKVGLVVCGGTHQEESMSETIRKAYHQVEQEQGSRFRAGHSAKTIKRALELP